MKQAELVSQLLSEVSALKNEVNQLRLGYPVYIKVGRDESAPGCTRPMTRSASPVSGMHG